MDPGCSPARKWWARTACEWLWYKRVPGLLGTNSAEEEREREREREERAPRRGGELERREREREREEREERVKRGIRWLERGFQIDTKTYMLTVQTLVTWANEGFFWELMLIRNISDWKMYISTALQRGWPLAMFVQSIPKAIVASQAVENYGNTSAAMQEDVWLEHGESVVDGHTDSGAPVGGYGASGIEVDDEGNGSQREAQEQAYEGHGSQAEPQGQEDEGHGSQAEPQEQGMAEEELTPELLDPGIDLGHRSYMSAVQHKHLAIFQCRLPKEYLELDNRWIERLRGVGLLTFYRLVEGGPVGRHGRARPRMMIDNSLIMALVDRWRSETHTFHLPCGEMAPTQQDVAYLLGLPIAGDAVGPRVVPASWRDDLEVRFAGVDRLDHLGALDPHPNSRGSAKSWLLQFQATNLHPDADDDSVRRSLEAYLLWLFGFIIMALATPSTRSSYPTRKRDSADAPEDAVPLWSWGSAVLAATYRGLCDACINDESNARFQGCALLLQLWSYERLAVGRPTVDHRAYEAQYYGEHDDDGPTMGTLWVCPREARRTYPNFVVELDQLVAENVIWEPYSAEFVTSRAPYGLSSWCTSNEALWYTTVSLVYDIYIEAHSPDRVMRQFGYARNFRWHIE
ncbi:LOW QUALITY PROTEIN: hypothetical protein U9M48_020614 [Paspalum notatum var. saurae]|uniref:Aminotransferase-like plant mobile domain-containing protein n=1 Tax=Paspalum notatum var. saurae TaxID=547442 RepID=A0AAQ3WS71_PASNO